jgi:hypothetical protein
MKHVRLAEYIGNGVYLQKGAKDEARLCDDFRCNIHVILSFSISALNVKKNADVV